MLSSLQCRRLLLCVLLALPLILEPVLIHATTYYTATTGNNNNPGTTAQPFQTIGKGISVLRPGDTLFIKGGTYPERLDSNSQTIPAGTDWNNVITIAAVPGEQVILKPGPGGEVINWTHPHIQYLWIKGLIIDATNVAFGVSLGGGVHHLWFQDGEVRNAQRSGIINTGSPASSYHLFTRMRIHHNGRERLDHGIYIQTNDNLIDGCEIYANSGYGVHVFNNSGQRANNNVIRHNRIYGNGAGGEGYGAATINYGDNNQFYNNLVYNNPRGIDVLWGGPTNTKIYNNTFFNNPAYIAIEIGQAQGTVFQNNILRHNGKASQNRDIVNDGSGSIISHNLIGDPKFTNEGQGDLTLQKGSPAINAGVVVPEITTDFTGKVRPTGRWYDLGAYAFREDTRPAAPANLTLKAP